MPWNSPLVSAAEAHSDGDFVLIGYEVVDMCLEVGERTSHQLEALLPGLATVERLRHLRVMDHDVRRNDGKQPLRVAGVERSDRLEHERGVFRSSATIERSRVRSSLRCRVASLTALSAGWPMSSPGYARTWPGTVGGRERECSLPADRRQFREHDPAHTLG
jgi:hypothetical protein